MAAVSPAGGTSCPALGAPPAASGPLFEDRCAGGQPACGTRPDGLGSWPRPGLFVPHSATGLPAPCRDREAGRCPHRAFARPGPRCGPGSPVKTRRLPRWLPPDRGAPAPPPDRLPGRQSLRSGLASVARSGGTPSNPAKWTCAAAQRSDACSRPRLHWWVFTARQNALQR